MKASGLPQSPGRTRNAAGAAFDLVAAKLRRPAARPGTIPRFPLVGRLAAPGSPPIVSVVAPSGYGKTTLLAQWAERGDQAFAWVSVDERDNDPKVLLSYVAEALNSVQPLDERVFEALASPTSSVPGTVVPLLSLAFSALTVPVVLVLDDVHLLENRECRDAVSVLADRVPPGSRLALAGRHAPPLRVARLRAQGRLLEIDSADLALDQADAAALLRAAEVTLDDDDVAVLHQQTEGWAAGLYLAALFLLEGGSLDHAAMSFGGDDRLVSQYMESEFLARISARHREFLTRTSVLERMSPALCEAVLDLPGSDMTLAELARSNLLLVPLDRDGQWYRYHHLFRDMLLAELERGEPGLLPVLRRRAAAWCLSNDLPEEALEYAMAADDVRMAADLVGTLAVPARRGGRITTLLRWLRWLEERGAINEHPVVMVLAALIYAWLGRPAEAERWIDAVDRWQDANAYLPGDTAVRAWAALDQAFMCRRGVARMLADADQASRAFTAAGIATGAPALLQGIARILSGDLDGSEVILADAVKLGQETSTRDIAAAALAERSLTAMARGGWARADGLAGQAQTMLRLAGAEESYFAPLVCAVQARVAIHRGDVTAALQQLASAQRARRLLTYAVPHVAVQARIELARVHLDLDDMAEARTLMEEIDAILERRPELGTLVDEARELRARLLAQRVPAQRGPATPGVSSLTTAELRVLPMLATHLSYPEIAAELSVSANTIKSQAYSIFRKLGASSRSEAVTRSRQLELLDG
jgi:LuxR family transcriptional regulator, maltose regulon positive regulatory protein